MKTQTSCETTSIFTFEQCQRFFQVLPSWHGSVTIGGCFTKTTMVTWIAYYVSWVWYMPGGSFSEGLTSITINFDSQALLCCCPGSSSGSIFSTQDMHRDLAGHFYEILRTLGHWRSYTQPFIPQNLSDHGYVTVEYVISIFHPHVGGPIVAVKVSSLKETQLLP